MKENQALPAQQFEVSLSGSVITLSGVLVSHFLKCLECCEGNPSSGIEPMAVGGTPGFELVRGCVDFHGNVALAQKALIAIRGLALPAGEALRKHV